jgi:hypothetical protein
VTPGWTTTIRSGQSRGEKRMTRLVAIIFDEQESAGEVLRRALGEQV